ncbi:uncharacterized protein VTP21DRAFT_5652 [Calcarisporiella thermophila]|uniref:uncharacterized protein n=1 Tax=Calcarisporiella thermophila TaxID=911321 RepID=UPI003742AB58
MHPNPAAFLESYYRNELEPALVQTAIAFSAIHLLASHAEIPIKKQLYLVAENLLIQAKLSLEDIFDAPSPQAVLAFMNMEDCMTWLVRLDKAYVYYSQAAMMALALGMDKEDPSVGDPVEMELRKRIWALVCQREIVYRFKKGSPQLIRLETIRSSPKPTVTVYDSEKYKLDLMYFMKQIDYVFNLLELQDIDWSLPDVVIIQQLVSIAAFLQNNYQEFAQFCEENVRLWRQFIKSDAPSGRLNTELMRQMREKALVELVKGYLNSISFIVGVIKTQNWCNNYPFLSMHMICENGKFIAHIHPDIRIRRRVFQELAQLQDLFRLLENKGIVENWLVGQIVNTLEEMKPAVFSENELVTMRQPKLRRLMMKPNKDN